MKIDIHTHILPKELPKWKDRFGYGGFIELHHHGPGCAKMMTDEGKFFREIESNCWDANKRCEESSKFGVTHQVLSTVPVMFSYWTKPEDGLTVAKFLNDDLAQTVRSHRGRFFGLGTVPMQSVPLAIKEAERCIKTLGLQGLQIGTHVNGKNLGEPEFADFFAAIEEMGACLFIHPWDMLGGDRLSKYWMPWLVGMPTEVTVSLCSMLFSGVFARHPKLRVAFAHGGGSFPGTYGRIRHGFEARPDLVACDHKEDPDRYFKKGDPHRQIYFDTLVHDPRQLRLLLDWLGPERLALGTDYPFPLGELEPGHLIESLKLSAKEQERLLAGTALEWLGVR